ncbi:MAG: glutamate--tRNA ligase family protein [Patescibacteria group bacterium]|nr:glutamate--tRNA ligase family protein [bacterium]MDZ4240938.1 glutamate--tRNA ligase family protein [Patescibacteria group bacterium]
MEKSDTYSTQIVVTRFAPSPTGFFTLGNCRTALFNYIYARQHEGKFILRIEDTDKERSKKEYEDDILENFKWLGFSHDEFYRQSERGDVYRRYLEKLITEGKAYVSKEEMVKEGDRSEVIRFKNPGTKICFADLIRGEVCFDTTELKDFVIAKSLDEPVFHFAVVIDDFEMGVTHVIRGEDHISNTPRQILVQEAIGAPRPAYAHLPLILAPDRSKLSKRNGGMSIRECRERGYLPEAVINYLALLGWNPGTDQEKLSLENLILQFRLNKIQKGGAVFNPEKFNWVNKEYIRDLPQEKMTEIIGQYAAAAGKTLPGEMAVKITPLVTERVEKLEDLKAMFDSGELDFFVGTPEYPAEKLSWKDTPKEKTITNLKTALTILSTLSEEEFNATEVKEALWEYAEKEGRGNVLWPIRFSLSGKDKSPDPFTLASVLGKKETLARISSAIQKL